MTYLIGDDEHACFQFVDTRFQDKRRSSAATSACHISLQDSSALNYGDPESHQHCYETLLVTKVRSSLRCELGRHTVSIREIYSKEKYIIRDLDTLNNEFRVLLFQEL
jgi:hypothetical protein